MRSTAGCVSGQALELPNPAWEQLGGPFPAGQFTLAWSSFSHQGQRDLDFPSNLMNTETTRGESQLLAFSQPGSPESVTNWDHPVMSS